MTVKEFYEWAKKHKVQDYEIAVNDRFGSLYTTQDPDTQIDINEKLKEVEL